MSNSPTVYTVLETAVQNEILDRMNKAHLSVADYNMEDFANEYIVFDEQRMGFIANPRIDFWVALEEHAL